MQRQGNELSDPFKRTVLDKLFVFLCLRSLRFSDLKSDHLPGSEEWLKRMDKNMGCIKPIMESTYGKDSAVKWTVYWRTFFMAVAELFGYNNGDEWMVALFLFKMK